ncbi:MAG: hypothetical protein FWG91_09730 [Lachnospiraceae bacterium]|nr:hypothetical protein [Lachnospiraceae bacterium]
MKRRFNIYFIYDLLGASFYGLVLYFGFTWLAGFSFLYAHLWNIIMLIFAASINELSDKLVSSDEKLILLKQKYGAEKASLILTGGFISFKTVIYLFYLLILLASQINDFTPILINKSFENFIISNNYSVLLLIAFDSLIKQFSKDKKKAKTIEAKLKESWGENQD